MFRVFVIFNLSLFFVVFVASFTVYSSDVKDRYYLSDEWALCLEGATRSGEFWPQIQNGEFKKVALNMVWGTDEYISCESLSGDLYPVCYVAVYGIEDENKPCSSIQNTAMRAACYAGLYRKADACRMELVKDELSSQYKTLITKAPKTGRPAVLSNKISKHCQINSKIPTGDHSFLIDRIENTMNGVKIFAYTANWFTTQVSDLEVECTFSGNELKQFSPNPDDKTFIKFQQELLSEISSIVELKK